MQVIRMTSVGVSTLTFDPMLHKKSAGDRRTELGYLCKSRNEGKRRCLGVMAPGEESMSQVMSWVKTTARAMIKGDDPVMYGMA